MDEGSTNWFVDRYLLIHTGTHGHASKYPRTCYGWASEPERYGHTAHTHTHTHTPHTAVKKIKGRVRYSTWTCVH